MNTKGVREALEALSPKLLGHLAQWIRAREAVWPVDSPSAMVRVADDLDRLAAALATQRDAGEGAVETWWRDRSMLYQEALTLLWECDHGDEAACGCRDQAHDRMVRIHAMNRTKPQPGAAPPAAVRERVEQAMTDLLQIGGSYDTATHSDASELDAEAESAKNVIRAALRARPEGRT